jgi:hypothetical protein
MVGGKCPEERRGGEGRGQDKMKYMRGVKREEI